MKNPLACALLLAALAIPPAHAEGNDDPRAVTEIGAVVQAFQAALVAKDGAALQALFLPADNSWLAVASDAKHQAGRPRVRPSSYRRFADFIATSKEPVEERFHNVRIHSNGSIGAVYFDFDFVEGGKVTNRGSESWHLVKTEEGWKISSMVFSLG